MTHYAGSRLFLQLDSNDGFYRLFIILDTSINALDACLPCIEIDCTFMKHHTYIGVCVMVVSKDGDLKNVPIAMALLPSESTDVFLWVFMNLKAARIYLHNMAVFSDRGKQMNAQRRLTSYGATWLHIKNSTYHISKIVCGIFSPNDSTLHSYVFG
jgi:hypothetical protein